MDQHRGSIRAVVCDLGGVVIRIDSDRIRDRFTEHSELPADEVHAAYPDLTYEAFERDEIDVASYLDHLRSRLRLRGTDDDLLAWFNDLYLGVDDGVVELLRGLGQRGLQVVALTNTNRAHHRVWSNRYRTALAAFGRVYCSHDLGARKPEAAAYHRVLDAEGLAPREVVFVDDVHHNVEAARAIGLTGISFTGLADLEVALDSILGPR